MGIPIPGAEAEAQILKLTVEMKGDALLFSCDVRLVNQSDSAGKGQASVFRFCDLPSETSEKLRSLLADIEIHAGNRFFEGLIPGIKT